MDIFNLISGGRFRILSDIFARVDCDSLTPKWAAESFALCSSESLFPLSDFDIFNPVSGLLFIPPIPPESKLVKLHPINLRLSIQNFSACCHSSDSFAGNSSIGSIIGLRPIFESDFIQLLFLVFSLSLQWPVSLVLRLKVFPTYLTSPLLGSLSVYMKAKLFTDLLYSNNLQDKRNKLTIFNLGIKVNYQRRAG